MQPSTVVSWLMRGATPVDGIVATSEGRAVESRPQGSWLRVLAAIEPHEQRPLLLAFLLLFSVLCGYFMLRPVRETIGTVLGEQEVEHLFMATWLASIAIIPLYGLACSVLPRTVVIGLVYGVFGASLAVLAGIMSVDPGNLPAARFFYVWISVFNLLVVSAFWTLMVDRFSREQPKRTFGVIAAGGTVGALLAPLATDALVEHIAGSGILLASASLFGIAVILHVVLLRVLKPELVGAVSPAATSARIGGNPFAGITLVLRSPYLLGFCLFVILLASATTFLYFDQLRLVRELYPAENDRTQIFARIDFVVQALALTTQLFFTSRIAKRLGVAVLLVSVPVAMMLGFVALALVSSFWTLAIVVIARRAGEYALTRPGREILFTSVDVEAKYKAKNLIDVVVYRGGDALSAWLRGALRASGAGFGAIAMVGAGIALSWGIVGLWLGRRHERPR